MRLPFFIAKRYFKAREGAFINFITIISILGVAVGVAALIIALSISTGFTETMKRKIRELYADLNIFSFTSEISDDEAEKIIYFLKNEKSVEAYTPITFGVGVIIGNTKIPKVAKVIGIEEKSFKDVVNLLKYVKGETKLSNNQDEELKAILGRELANSLGIDTGDIVKIIFPKNISSPFGFFPKTLSFKVIGTLNSEYYLYDSEYVYLDFNLTKELFTPKGIHGIGVKVKEKKDLNPLKDKILEKFPLMRVLDITEVNREFFKALKLERLILFLTIGLIVMVASLNIISTLILLVTQKTKDIGILRSFGASKRDIKLIFLYHGLFIGIVGTILGDFVGIFLSLTFNKYKLIPLSTEVYPIPYVPFETSFGQVFIVTIFSLFLSFISTLYPSSKASKLSPLDALRYE